MCRDVPKSGMYHISSMTTVALLLLFHLHLTCADLQSEIVQDGHAEHSAYSQKAFVPVYTQQFEGHRRSRRDVTQLVISSKVVPENVNYDEDLIDLEAVLPNRTFSIASNSLEIPDMFIVTADSKLRLNSLMNEIDRKKFDFDTHPSIEVYINATSILDGNDVVELKAQLPLSDVNDEPPEYISQPKPYLATMAETVQAGTTVYTLTVTDADSNPDVTLRIASVSPNSETGRFQLDVVRTGNVWTASVVTVGNDNFQNSVEYNIEVTATDTNTQERDRMTTASVKVLVGQRPPQFYAPKFTCFIYESVTNTDRNRVSTENNVPLEIKTVSFQMKTVTYQVLESDGTLTRRFQMDDSGQIFNTEVIDYESLKMVNLKIRATESETSLTSLCEVEINVKDENDNSPIFPQSLYHHSVLEDIDIRSDVLNVTASDLDSHKNGELKFSISGSDFFEISASEKVDRNTYMATIKVKKQLDYDNVPDPTYTMTVHVTDKGTPPLTSTTQVSIYVANANDNAPEFDNSTIVISLLQTASPGYPVMVLQASDLDGDHVSFSFPEIPADRDSFSLPIQAIDDGSCCSPIKSQTSEVTFTVNIEGVNAHKPNFVNCSNYDLEASVEELSKKGTPVIQVQASDPDRGENGRILYALVYSDADFPFQIDEETGNITVIRENIKIDKKDYIQVTVTGENPVRGQPLKGWCTFRVQIEDINDHSPVFSQNRYEHEILASSEPVQIIRQIVATDEDRGINANLTYSLAPNNVFDIDPQSGVVSLVHELPNQPTDPCDDGAYCLIVSVEDGGMPKSRSAIAELHIHVKSGQTPPSWFNSFPDFTEFDVSESVDDIVITSLQCRSNIQNNLNVEFIVYDSENSINQASKTFRPETNGNNMTLILTEELDYKTKAKYQITVVCQNFGADNVQVSKNIIINVIDANNKFPEFVGLSLTSGSYEGSVAEDAPPGSTVIAVSANDEDTNQNFSTVAFKIDDVQNKGFFDVIPDTNGNNRAFIVTNSSLKLDREALDHYVITIVAYDNPMDLDHSNADRRLVHISVTDVNDNAPTFQQSLYQHNVSETSRFNTVVFTVTAHDNDTVDQNLGLNYFFEEGTTSNPFTIRPRTGEIIVSGELDYERDPKMYRLNLMATDQYQLHNATTVVEIFVTDENDNRPVFNPPSYSVENIVVEEDHGNTQSSPLFLTQVTATDVDQNSMIEYSLVDPAVPFTINKKTGMIYLIGVLDRDGPTPDYKLTVKAQDSPDEPLISYADVTVFPMDINDNSPVFDLPLSGSVLEHPAPNTRVMTVLARDKDLGLNGTVQYQLDPNQPTPTYSQYFNIDQSGDIVTRGSSRQLDREKTDELLLSIVAFDLGTPRKSTSATVTITLLDINDQSPYFQKPEYQIFAPENRKGQIGLIQPYDDDSDQKNKNFQFSLKGASRHFSILRQNNAASINIKETDPIDYDVSTDNREFTFLLKVHDGDLSHVAETRIKVNITDVNDNAPVFSENEIEVTFLDGTERGTFMAQFNASDKDEGLNSEIIFSITRESDLRYEFYIDPTTGIVTTRKELDREKETVIDLTIVATDKGEPPMNSTAKLIVTLNDINDNAPQFKEDYMPIVNENVKHKDKTVVEILAKDPDSPKFGPPFGFKLPDDCKELSCRYFQLEMNDGGDNNRGTAFIKTSTTFDREENKEYFLPIIMWDMRDTNDARSLTATNTLTIMIGDDNDNKHKAGHQDVFVYNYEGLDKPFEIGRVYADDPDDWDTPDKTFTFLSPDTMKSYFTVSKDTGIIQMKDGVPSNVDVGRPAYEFKVDVFDKKWGNTETCTVSVNVKTLTNQALWKSGSMRLTGISAEDFIVNEKSGGDSKYDSFRKKLASILGYSKMENIEVVSLMDHKNYLDVRFSAHGSPYLNPAQVESAVMLHQHEFETELGVKIVQLPINLCREEVYDDGCYTELNVTGLANMVNAKGTSFVGVQTFTAPVSACEDCIFPEPVECRGDYCYNGGTCVKDDWDKLVCKCPVNFDGPRCQQRRHSFSGSSIAFYKALSVCANGRTSFDFITTGKNGLIMSGMSAEAKGDMLETADDYILVELVNGYPQLRVNLGAGELMLTLDQAYSTQALKLDDGKWHHIDIDKSGKNIMLTVDKCSAGTVENSRLDDSSCSLAGIIPGPDILLNTQGFLQIGGFYPHTRNASTFPSVHSEGFSGCIRNLIHNTKLYDLHFKKIPQWNSGENNCPREDQICKPNNVAVCGEKANCVSEWVPAAKVVLCQCHPGWHGNKCRKETPIKDFESQSFFKWELSAGAINQAAREHSIQMMFRTRQVTGTLFAITSVNRKTILVQLVDSKITLFYDMGEGQQTLTLDQADASSGQWHTVRVDRFGSEFSISLDNAEGRNYNYRLRSKNSDANFTALPIVSAGARVPPERDDVTQLTYDLKSTCVTDIRFNGNYLPLEQSENSLSTAANLLESQNIENCTRKDCITPNCPPNYICYPLWEREECRCVHGRYESSPGTCSSNCDLKPCYNGGKCTLVDGEVSCACVGPWEGKLCNFIILEKDTNDDSLLAGEIAGITIGILILLVIIVLLALWILWYRSRNSEDEKFVDNSFNDDNFARENIMYHDEECAGEEDHEGFDLSILQMPDRKTNAKPVEAPTYNRELKRNAPSADKPLHPGVGQFIDQRMDDMDNEDIDSTKEYNYEGTNSEADSLSSLAASSQSSASLDYDYLNDWGPKFSRLADMYGAGQEQEQ